jgi:hypothetical protein
MERFPVLNFQTKSYISKTYTAAICRYNNMFLLLKISNTYPICPGDWEWLTCSVRFNNSDSSQNTLLQNAILSMKCHTGLIGEIVRIYPPLVWPDNEFLLTYILYPILIDVSNLEVHLLGDKFVDHRWVEWNEISRFDRNDYLNSYVKYLSF